MKNNTLFWVLAVIAVYVFIVSPKSIKRGTKEEKPTIADYDKAQSGKGGYTT